MKRLLKRLPHRRRDDTSEDHHSSQPKPTKTPSTRTTSTIFYDADDNDSTEPTDSASNGQPTTPQLDDASLDNRLSQQSKDGVHNKRLSQQSKDAAPHNPSRNSTMSELNKRGSGLVSYDRPVETSSLHSDTNKPKTEANDLGLQLGPQDTSLYDDLKYLTLGGDAREPVDPSRKEYSEDVADRNLSINEKRRLSGHTAGRRGSVFHVPAQVDEFSEDVANRNMESPPRSSTFDTKPYPLETQQEMNRRIATSPFFSDEFYDPRFEQHSAFNSRKASEASSPRMSKIPLGHQVDADSGYLGQFESSGSSSEDRADPTATRTPQNVQQIKQASQGKPLIGAPKTDFKDLDFNDSEDVDVYTRYAPAVTHETVIPEIRHVEEKVVTREIHNYDIFHRILPIKEIEVLPARHFVRDPTTGDLTEIPAPTPAREQGHQQWQLVATESDSGWQPAAPRTFTARTFGKDEGLFKESVGEDGIPRTETTWVHAPTIQDGAYKTGQTEALFMEKLNDSTSKGKTDGVSGGWSDGVHEREGQYRNGYCDGPEMEKLVQRPKEIA